MTPALKLNLMVCFPSYGGNGGISSEVPDIREWWSELVLKLRSDPRIGKVCTKTIADTPITMVRNKFFTLAKQEDCHLIMSVDSDQSPNKHAGEPGFKPFWEEAFNFIYANYGKGPRMVVAPYVGPAENVYVFKWRAKRNSAHTDYSLEQYTREEAAYMAGVQEVAAGPTGLYLMDMRLLDLIEPSSLSKRQVLEQVQSGQMDVNDALAALRDGYCYYEWDNQYADSKGSTEDVTLTRDISLAGLETLGYNPLYCAWDSWIGHWKPMNHGKPERFSTEHVGASLRKAVLNNKLRNEVCMEVSQAPGIPRELLAFAEPPPGYFAGRLNGHANGHADNSDTMTKTGRETVGPWFAHGHAPKEHLDALADLVRSEGYRKHPAQDELRILEVGSWLGSTAIAMADATTMTRVFCVDTWEGSPSDLTGEMAAAAIEEEGEGAVYRRFIANIGTRLDDTIFPFPGSSEENAKKAWPEKFDIIFIDAEHTYEALKAQIEEWWPHLKDDGVMCGHDFQVHGYDGVEQAVVECFGNKHSAFGFTPQGCMWRVNKADHPEFCCATSDQP